MKDLSNLNERQMEDLLIEEYIKAKYPMFRMRNYYRFLANRPKYEEAKLEGAKNLPRAIMRKNSLYNVIENVRELARRIIKSEIGKKGELLSWQTRAIIRLNSIINKNGWLYPTKGNMEKIEV